MITRFSSGGATPPEAKSALVEVRGEQRTPSLGYNPRNFIGEILISNLQNSDVAGPTRDEDDLAVGHRECPVSDWRQFIEKKTDESSIITVF